MQSAATKVIVATEAQNGTTRSAMDRHRRRAIWKTWPPGDRRVCEVESLRSDPTSTCSDAAMTMLRGATRGTDVAVLSIVGTRATRDQPKYPFYSAVMPHRGGSGPRSGEVLVKGSFFSTYGKFAQPRRSSARRKARSIDCRAFSRGSHAVV